jgi:hypothetical protein
MESASINLTAASDEVTKISAMIVENAPVVAVQAKDAFLRVSEGALTVQLPLTHLVNKLDAKCPEAIPVIAASSLLLSSAFATSISGENTRYSGNDVGVVGDVGKHAITAVVRANVDAVGTLAVDHAVNKCMNIDSKLDFGKMTDFLGLHLANRLLFGFVDVATKTGFKTSMALTQSEQAAVTEAGNEAVSDAADDEDAREAAENNKTTEINLANNLAVDSWNDKLSMAGSGFHGLEILSTFGIHAVQVYLSHTK